LKIASSRALSTIVLTNASSIGKKEVSKIDLTIHSYTFTFTSSITSTDRKIIVISMDSGMKGRRLHIGWHSASMLLEGFLHIWITVMPIDILKAQAPHTKLTSSKAAGVHTIQRGEADRGVRFSTCGQALGR
jgi:hypothetical protein